MSSFGNHFAYGEKAFALIVGISTFEDPRYSSKPLPQAIHDAADLALLLRQRLGWKKDNIQLCTGDVRKDDLKTAFKNLTALIGPLPTADLFLFYLSTHGHPYKKSSAGDQTVFLATDTLLSDPFSLADTGLTHHILGSYIDAIDARQKVIISDACFAASAMRADEIVPPQPYAGIDAAVLSSSVGKAYALDQRNSVFTECLLRVLSNSNGEIGVAGLADDISRNLPADWPAPFLDARGRYIVLGVVGEVASAPQAITFEQFLMFSQSQLQLVLTRYGKEATETGYVPRKRVESIFADYLRTSPAKTFSIVGPAGVGKSTLLMHLAEDANAQGFCVLWFSAAHITGNITIESLIVDAVSALHKNLTMEDLGNMLTHQRPLLIFIDAINEWSGDVVQLESLMADLAKLSASGPTRAIFTCREEIWLRLNQKRREEKIQEFETSAQLDVFDEEEFAAAIQIYEIPETSFGALSRQPLFLRMASAVFRDATGAGVGDFVDLFAKYVETKTSRVDTRLRLVAGQTLDRVEHVATNLLRNHAESIEVGEFLALVSEPLAVALFDEGLLRRVGDSVSFETELLYEYVLSRTLPPDPFAQIKDISSLRGKTYSNAWWRAAAFRLWMMTDVERLRTILTVLTSDLSSFDWRVGYVMQLGLHWRDITAFKEQYLKAFESANFITDEAFILLRQTLQKQTSETLEFVLESVRILFLNDWHYDWRPKKWDFFVLNGLRLPFTKGLDERDRPGYVLYECFATAPYETFYILVSQWLSDETKLEDDEAMIRDVAAMFLMAFASEAPQDFQRAVTDSLRSDVEFSVDGGMWLHRVVAKAVEQRPHEFIGIASVWTADSSLKFQYLGIEVVKNLPEELAAEALRVITRYLERADLPLNMANQAISWVGRIPSRKVLDFLIKRSEFAEHQSAIADACRFLVTVFPVDILKLIDQLAAQPLIRPDARVEILKFYCNQLPSTAKEACEFFRSSIEVEPSKHNRDIAYSIMVLQRPNPYITDFVEERLKLETQGIILEYYHYYLKKVRFLSIEDMPWVERWIESNSPTYGLLPYVAGSPLPLPAKLRVVTILDQQDPGFMLHCVNSVFADSAEEAISKLAVDVYNSSTHASLSVRGQKWFALIAAGNSSSEALETLKREERIAFLENQS